MRVITYLQAILRTMPRPFLYSAYPWRTKALLAIDWRSIFNLHESVKHNKPHWSRACTASRQVLHWLLWKHHFAPLDTSRALALRLVLASSNPSLSQLHPVVRTRTPAPSHWHPAPPIHRLPPELLTTIFTHTLLPSPRTPKDRFCHQITRRISSSPSSSPFPFPSPSQTSTTPLLLTHICRAWRLLAQHTPTLWSSIHVLCPVRADVAYVAFLLAQTDSSCPLTLGLAHYTAPDLAAEAIARLFVAQAKRWRRVSFTLMRCVQPQFAGLRPGGVPLLEAYEVRVDSWAEEDIEAFFDVLHSSGRLERVDWGKSLAGGMRKDTPWCKLVHLTLHCMDLSPALFASLSHCTSLKTLRMRRMLLPSPSSSPSSAPHSPTPIPITLPSLEHLVCHRFDSSSSSSSSSLSLSPAFSFAFAFSSLTLPSLVSLEITSRHPLAPPDVNALLSMLVRSGCMLRSLGVDGHSVPHLFRADLDQVFRGVEALTVLSDIKADELVLLARRSQDGDGDEDNPDILPNLHHLTLHNYHGNGKDGVLARVVASRSRSRRDELREVQVCLDLEGAPSSPSSPSSPSFSSSPAPAPSTSSFGQPIPTPHKHEQDLATLLALSSSSSSSSGVKVSIHEPVSGFPTYYFRGNPREVELESGVGEEEDRRSKAKAKAKGVGAVPMMHMLPDLDTLW